MTESEILQLNLNPPAKLAAVAGWLRRWWRRIRWEVGNRG
jgi:hypothetical protein